MLAKIILFLLCFEVLGVLRGVRRRYNDGELLSKKSREALKEDPDKFGGVDIAKGVLNVCTVYYVILLAGAIHLTIELWNQL